MRKSVLCSAAPIAIAALVASTTPAHAKPTPDAHSVPTPIAKARAAGVTSAGGGYAGWEQRGSKSSTSVQAKALAGRTQGIDVSGYQGNVDWAGQYRTGVRWAYTKATESTYYTNQSFSQQYNGSYNAGMVRGAYSFAIPNGASAVAQADYFVAHGGGWSKDGKTLPGMLDIEYNPYGASCYGLSQSAMVSWIRAWLNEYKAKTRRDAVIYTTTDWWSSCTGNSSAFSQTNPLWIARYQSTPGTLPAGWSTWTMWQYASTPIDKDYFNGDLSRVVALANG